MIWTGPAKIFTKTTTRKALDINLSEFLSKKKGDIIKVISSFVDTDSDILGTNTSVTASEETKPRHSLQTSLQDCQRGRQ